MLKIVQTLTFSALINITGLQGREIKIDGTILMPKLFPSFSSTIPKVHFPNKELIILMLLFLQKCALIGVIQHLSRLPVHWAWLKLKKKSLLASNQISSSHTHTTIASTQAPRYLWAWKELSLQRSEGRRERKITEKGRDEGGWI